MRPSFLESTSLMKIKALSKNKYGVILAHIGALLTVSAWGTSFMSSKILMGNGGLSPVELYIYRFAAAYIILLIFTCRKIFSNSLKHEMILALCGICAGSLYFITENFALELTTTGNVSLLASTSPLFITFIMAIVFRQRINPAVLIGSAIAFGGVACVIFSHGESLEFNPAGDLLAIAAAISWAVYSVAIKNVLPFYSSMFVSRKLFFYGVLTALPLLFLQKDPIRLGLIFDMSQPMYLVNFLFLVLFCSLGAYLVWNEVIKYLGPVTANNYMYLQPLVTMIVGYLVLGEKIYFLGYLGCFFIIAGLVVCDKMTGLFTKNSSRKLY